MPKKIIKPSPAPTPVVVTQSPTRLTDAMHPQDFAKAIKHIPDRDIMKLAMSSLNRVLVAKGLVSQMELQQAFLDEAEIKGF